MQSLSVGLVAHWPFDEGTGPVALDRSGNGTHARLDNPQWCVGPHGRGSAIVVGPHHSAVRFQHIADVFPIGDAPYAISAWVRKEEGDGSYVLIWGDWHCNQTTGMLLNPEQSGHVWLKGSLHTKETDGWHHLVMQYDGTQREIWRNGLCVARDVPGFPHATPHARTLAIGFVTQPPIVPPPSLPPRASFLVSDLRVYGRALAEDEVKALTAVHTAAPCAHGYSNVRN